MILDFNNRNLVNSHYDLLIVGGGAAGISLALEFIDAPFTVLLIESGSFGISRKNQELYKAKNLGLDYPDLSVQRARFFGGTTNFWGGTCIEFDPIDFISTSARKKIKWPIRFSELNVFINRAKSVCNIDTALSISSKKNKFSKILDLKFWQFSPFPFRFGERFRQQLDSAKNITVLLNANLTSISNSKDCTKIDSIEITSLIGQKKSFFAKNYVLATGGIENARLLLNFYASNNKLIALKNNNIGRYFSDHPTAIIGHLCGKDASKIYNHYKMRIRADGKEIKPILGFKPAYLKNNKLLNGVVAIWPIPKDNIVISRAKLLMRLIRRREFGLSFLINFLLIIPKSINLLPHVIHRLKGSLKELPYLPNQFEIRLVTETIPNPNSCVTLSKEKDLLGLKKACLSWNLTNLDRKTFIGLAKETKREIEKMGNVELKLADWIFNDSKQWSNYINKDGYYGHHMGTTRMSNNSKIGVVNKNCKIFGLDNLYIAGSSIFSTYSFANPTLTIVALAIRLADHLKKSKD